MLPAGTNPEFSIAHFITSYPLASSIFLRHPPPSTPLTRAPLAMCHHDPLHVQMFILPELQVSLI